MHVPGLYYFLFKYMSTSHLQKLCGRQVYVGINNLKAGSDILEAQLWKRSSEFEMYQTGQNSLIDKNRG